MDVAKAGEILVIMLSPTLAIGTALYLPRAVRAIRRAVRGRRDAEALRPTSPPIEQLAADLRRLLLEHDTMRRSTSVAMRAKHLRALEGAITDCALDAAVALGVPCPDRSGRAMSTAELRGLLTALAHAGLVLPPAVALLAQNRRL